MHTRKSTHKYIQTHTQLSFLINLGHLRFWSSSLLELPLYISWFLPHIWLLVPCSANAPRVYSLESGIHPFQLPGNLHSSAPGFVLHLCRLSSTEFCPLIPSPGPLLPDGSRGTGTSILPCPQPFLVYEWLDYILVGDRILRKGVEKVKVYEVSTVKKRGGSGLRWSDDLKRVYFQYSLVSFSDTFSFSGTPHFQCSHTTP